MEQKYGYVPALSKVNENFSSVSSTLDLNTFSVLTIVWGISSRFAQVTVVPTATVRVAGPKLKLSTFTSAVAGCGAFAELSGEAADSRNAATITVESRPKIHTVFLIISISFPDLARIHFLAPTSLGLHKRRVNNPRHRLSL